MLTSSETVWSKAMVVTDVVGDDCRFVKTVQCLCDLVGGGVAWDIPPRQGPRELSTPTVFTFFPQFEGSLDIL